MPTLATCRSSERGFTLLEMLVVLLLVGLIVSLIMPGLERMNASLGRALQRNQVQTLINSLALEVQRGGRSLLLEGSAEQVYAELPESLRDGFSELQVGLEVPEPIFVSSAGFCPFGGEMTLHLHGHRYPAQLTSPGCRLQW